MASFDGTKNYMTLQQRADLNRKKQKPLKFTTLDVCITTLFQMCCSSLDTHPKSLLQQCPKLTQLHHVKVKVKLTL
jgi:hypothetical protein